MQELLYPAAVVLLGYVVLGITGFGSALVIVPLLAWRWPLPEVVPLVLLLDVPASLLLGGLNLRHVNFAELRRLLPGMVAGALAGLWLSSQLASRWPLLALGLYVAVVGAQALRTAPPRRQHLAAPWGYAAGGAMGLVEMLFGTAGPLVVAWLARRLPDVHVLRASTPIVITVSAGAALLTMGWAGRLSQADLWWRWLGLVGVAACGVVIGNRWACRVSPELLRRAICCLLVISGLALVAHALKMN
ncbi:sulfite exporter TauE/SafE family protein [Acidovorax soli]|uniref:sulfite exporter TauE/SafE family protein n=1 Tax=Acidovorax TaxID=12916 RepID=UPI0026EE529A|nr:sulfite exporter TauE/SafE family protein [Acidovorax soli]MCM2345072.1 sulfite exporter TauE/SafE family protein [Acidovorax soli]